MEQNVQEGGGICGRSPGQPPGRFELSRQAPQATSDDQYGGTRKPGVEAERAFGENLAQCSES